MEGQKGDELIYFYNSTGKMVKIQSGDTFNLNFWTKNVSMDHYFMVDYVFPFFWHLQKSGEWKLYFAVRLQIKVKKMRESNFLQQNFPHYYTLFQKPTFLSKYVEQKRLLFNFNMNYSIFFACFLMGLEAVFITSITMEIEKQKLVAKTRNIYK